jgi:hypothetical protein
LLCNWWPQLHVQTAYLLMLNAMKSCNAAAAVAFLRRHERLLLLSRSSLLCTSLHMLRPQSPVGCTYTASLTMHERLLLLSYPND